MGGVMKYQVVREGQSDGEMKCANKLPA